ncbi:hypothetical protein EWM60_17570 [Candidatus Erwinia dacicola]|nr:hypothetical protein [Candidatus Erwinia dacicola]
MEPHIQAFIRKELPIHTSLGVINGRLQLEFGISVSKNTLYRYIQRSDTGGELYQQLPHRGKRYSLGKNQKLFLLTLVDKALKTVIIRKLPNKRAKTVVAAFRELKPILSGVYCAALPFLERGLNEHTNG